MSSHGIKDRVAIVGMGCTKFGEHWNKNADDLLIESTTAALNSAGVTKQDIDAYWVGTAMSGNSGMTVSRPLQLHNKPVTRVENFCATGLSCSCSGRETVIPDMPDIAVPTQ